MKQPSELKDVALSALRGHWISAVLLFFVFSILALVGVGMSLFIPFVPLVLYPMELVLEVCFLEHLRGDERALSVENLFNKYGDYFVAGVLKRIFIGLCLLLLIIPGIVKAYSYAMTSYIVKDNPGIGANDAIEMSMKLMNGHKFELFYLHLTFIGWGILCLLTCGIGFLWLQPYIYTAQAEFYHDLLEENNISYSAITSSSASSSEMKF